MVDFKLIFHVDFAIGADRKRRTRRRDGIGGSLRIQ